MPSLTVRLLGFPLLEVEWVSDEGEDAGAALNGGTLGSERVEAGGSDLVMGNGREVEE